MIMEVCGIPPKEVLDLSQRKKKFFTDDNSPILIANSRGKTRRPGTKVLEDILNTDDLHFIRFVEKCLDWNPATRMTPEQALRHPWILDGLPPKVLIHHQKLHNIPTAELPPHIKERRRQYLMKEQQIQSENRRGETGPEGVVSPRTKKIAMQGLNAEKSKGLEGKLRNRRLFSQSGLQSQVYKDRGPHQ